MVMLYNLPIGEDILPRTTTGDQTRGTEYVDVAGGRIAYEVVGYGPLVVLSPGMGDTRSSFRFLAPLIVNAGYRVASVDLRGHGESEHRLAFLQSGRHRR